jgi:hypothetical protein
MTAVQGPFRAVRGLEDCTVREGDVGRLQRRAVGEANTPMLFARRRSLSCARSKSRMESEASDTTTQ